MALVNCLKMKINNEVNREMTSEVKLMEHFLENMYLVDSLRSDMNKKLYKLNEMKPFLKDLKTNAFNKNHQEIKLASIIDSIRRSFNFYDKILNEILPNEQEVFNILYSNIDQLINNPTNIPK